MRLLFTIFVFEPLLLVNLSESACPKNATCDSLPTCAPFMKVIRNAQKPLQRDLVKILRSQECGFESSYPKVCCSNSAFRGSKFENDDAIQFPSDDVILPSTPEEEKIRQKRIEQMNKVLIESGILDFIGFDMFRRHKGGYLLDMDDVEIR